MKSSLLAAGSYARFTTRLGQVRCLNANIPTEPVKSVQATSRPKTKISDEKIRFVALFGHVNSSFYEANLSDF